MSTPNWAQLYPIYPVPFHPVDTDTCTCHDPEVDTLRAMIAAGWDQRAASKALWSPQADQAAATAAHLASIRTAFTTAFPWLRLPDIGAA